MFFGFQAFLQSACKLLFIFYNEDLHVPPLRKSSIDFKESYMDTRL